MFYPFSYWHDVGANLRNNNTFIAYWKLNETTTNATRVNSVRNDYHLSTVNNLDELDNVNISSGLFNTDKAVAFDRNFSTSHPHLLYRGSGSGLTIGNDEFSMMAWVKSSGIIGDWFSLVDDTPSPGAPEGTYGYDIISKSDGGNYGEYILALSDTALPLALFGGYKDPGGADNQIHTIITGTNSIPSDRFSFLMMQYNKTSQQLILWQGISGTNLVKIQGTTNGFYEPSPKAYSENGGNTYAFRVGHGDLTNFLYNFAGVIDEIGFWRRVLSDNEVKALYNQGRGWTYPFTFPKP